MTNLEKYDKIFRENFSVTQDELKDLKYRGIPAWDSFGHMSLISLLEERFEILMSTKDVLAFTSYEKGKEILLNYGVEMES
ncbi:MAG: hypothetical protein SOW48_06170 [Peptoniphilaceae bacterium]|nr:hypothetical protein [Peptoniphilaceae bacterium]MCI6660135.1 hypothetical protein [Peptoniphilaceae bacterium]MDD7433452.1 hypothetical protein [Peptoniphilaceae bacterium]MDD7543607.1 hypothetical protein [Peptoniphilaceae bacterium]MDY3076218.1 hypothetical protein [Peptoniphilaceae bacterium]